MDIVTKEDVDFLAQQSTEKLNMIIAGMVALMNDTNIKVADIEKQTWYQRMIKTVFGKNKITKEEIKQNHEKMSIYMSEAIAELYNRNCIDQKIIISLANQINYLHTEQLKLKQMIKVFVNKLNDKIDSNDNYTQLYFEIQNGKYSKDSSFVAICKIIAMFDNRIIQDTRKMGNIEELLENKAIINDKKNTMINCLEEILNISAEEVVPIYLELGLIRDNYLADVILNIIESYHFLSDMNRKLIDKKKIINDVLSEKKINASVYLSSREVLENFIKCKRDVITNLETELKEEYIYEDKDCSNEKGSDEILLEDKKLVFDEKDSKVFFEDVEETAKREDEYITSILRVLKDEHKKWIHKNLHINSYIDCEGSLEFVNCIIYYNEEDNPNAIKLIENGSVLFKNCTIINKGGTVCDFLINGQKKNRVVFEQCTFEDCSKCIQVEDADDIIIKNCRLNNCCQQFAVINLGMGNAEVSGCSIIVDNVAKFNQGKDCKKNILFYFKKPMKWDGDDFEKINIFNNQIIEKDEFKEINDGEMCYFYTTHRGDTRIKVHNCTFIGAVNCLINVDEVKDCVFLNCRNVIQTKMRATIEDCCFEHCADVLLLEACEKISYCQFIECFHNVITTTKFCVGGICVESSEFINIRNNNAMAFYCLRDNKEFIKAMNDSYNVKQKMSIPNEVYKWENPIFMSERSYADALIVLNRLAEQDKKSAQHKGWEGNREIIEDEYTNIIQRCIFNGIDLNFGFLVQTIGGEKKEAISVSLTECNFRNCTSKRKDEKLIQEYGAYDTIFKKTIVYKMNYVQACSGLDKINKEKIMENDIKVKNKNMQGEEIGSTIIECGANGFVFDKNS